MHISWINVLQSLCGSLNKHKFNVYYLKILILSTHTHRSPHHKRGRRVRVECLFAVTCLIFSRFWRSYRMWPNSRFDHGLCWFLSDFNFCDWTQIKLKVPNLHIRKVFFLFNSLLRNCTIRCKYKRSFWVTVFHIRFRLDSTVVHLDVQIEMWCYWNVAPVYRRASTCIGPVVHRRFGTVL